MEASRKFVILIDALGRSLQLERDLWVLALQTALGSGWKPARTAAPPLESGLRPGRAELPWCGSYSEPRGQLVNHVDAALLGEALRNAPELPSPLEPVAEFCLRGSFMVCPFSPDLRAYLDQELQHAPAPASPRTPLAISLNKLQYKD